MSKKDDKREADKYAAHIRAIADSFDEEGSMAVHAAYVYSQPLLSEPAS